MPKDVFGSMAPTQQGRPTDLLGIIKQMYPMLRDANIGLVNSPNADSGGNMMESWPVGEPGAPDYQRPAELPIDQFGVQVFDQNTTPRDIAADVFSHNVVNSDPALKGDYEAFTRTFETPEGKTRLLKDYQWARQNANETRPLNEWAQADRIPAYFRGYVFSQWPNAEKAFAPEQLDILKRMSARVHGSQK